MDRRVDWYYYRNDNCIRGMKTEVLQGKIALKRASELIAQGEVVAFPTETVYGLGANAFDSEAVSKIFVAKGRPNDNPLIVHVADKSDITPLVDYISPYAQAIIDNFMPGPITVIMPKSDKVPSNVSAGLSTVGIRMPMHPVAREFIRECGLPIAAPSANNSTHISPTSAKHVYDDMQGKIPLIVDGGNCEVGIESTIIDTTTDVPTILRPGAITAQDLAKVLGQVVNFTGEVIVAKAPGLKYKHYAPTCEMVVAKELADALAEYDRKSKNCRPVLICSTIWTQKVGDRRVIDVGDNDKQVARNIYGAMHEAQEIGDYIICQDFGDSGVMLSVMNRVIKASGGKRI